MHLNKQIIFDSLWAHGISVWEMDGEIHMYSTFEEWAPGTDRDLRGLFEVAIEVGVRAILNDKNS